jgi:hypothetical protein
MTYNFDPDRWLMDRYDAMMQRLAGTFEIPKQ